MLGTSRRSRLALAAFGLFLMACGNEGVGDPCLPENIPEDGFNANENYVESSSVQCRSRVCIVHRLQGKPAPECGRTDNPGGCPIKDDDQCRDHLDTEECGAAPLYKHVYCTCRCNGPAGFDYCECPDGFECSDEEILSLGGKGIRGNYCVRKGV